MSIGDRIAIERRRRGWSQAVMAEQLGRSAPWLSNIERGVRSVDRYSVLSPIARLLGMSVAELTKDALAEPTAREAESESVRAVRVALGGFGFIAASRIEARPADLDVLRARVRDAWELTHLARFEELGRVVPELLHDCEHLAWAERHGLGLRLVAELHHVVAAMMAKLGDAEAAWVAADRSVFAATQAGDAALAAASAFRLGHAFLSAGRLDQAARTVEVATTALLPAAWAGDPDATALWGALHLVKAVTAARSSDRDAALAALTNAEAAAGRLGTQYRDVRFDTEFGARNVALHSVTVAVELRDSAAALRYWSEVDVEGLSAERRARLLVDVARAHAQERRGDAAVQALEEADELAPEMIRCHRLARETVIGLVRRRQPARAKGGRFQLAARMGIL